MKLAITCSFLIACNSVGVANKDDEPVRDASLDAQVTSETAPDQGGPEDLAELGPFDLATPPEDRTVDAPAAATITTSQTSDRIMVTSTAPPTWKLEIATTASASSSSPGGGTAIALHVPAGGGSLVDPDPNFCCSAKGLDNLEWRYVPSGTTTGVRSDMARHAEISKLDVLTNTPSMLELRIEGSWPGVSSYVREITVTPDGYSTEMDVTYDGVTGNKSMWWMMSLFHSDKVDGETVRISDIDTSWITLPQEKECVCPVPSEISFPYRISFPLKAPAGQSIVLQVDQFADTSQSSRNYELWPEEQGYYFFFPRWVSVFQKTTYHFEWSWRFTPQP